MDGSIYQFDSLSGVIKDHSGLSNAHHMQALRRPGLRDKPLVGVIRNPRSHRNRGHMPELHDKPNVFTASPPTRTELARVLAGFAQRGVDLIAVDGGDGTVRDVLTCGAQVFGNAWPKLIVLPKGKTNALAFDLGLPPAWTLADALEAASAGKVVERCPVVIGQADGSLGKVMGFVFGAGIFTTATQAGQTAHRFGAFDSFAVGVTAVAGIFQALFGIGKGPWRKTTEMRIGLGPQGEAAAHSGHGDERARYAMAFSTLERFPAGLNPFGRIKTGLRFVLVDAPLRRVIALIPFMLAGWDRPRFAKLGVHRGVVSEALIDLGDSFILDGEAFPAGRYRIQTGPKLQFIVP